MNDELVKRPVRYERGFVIDAEDSIVCNLLWDTHRKNWELRDEAGSHIALALNEYPDQAARISELEGQTRHFINEVERMADALEKTDAQLSQAEVYVENARAEIITLEARNKVRPEFMEAAVEHLRKFDPQTPWGDTAMALCVAAFGQQQFDAAQNGLTEIVWCAGVSLAPVEFQRATEWGCVACKGSHPIEVTTCPEATKWREGDTTLNGD